MTLKKRFKKRTHTLKHDLANKKFSISFYSVVYQAPKIGQKLLKSRTRKKTNFESPLSDFSDNPATKCR